MDPHNSQQAEDEQNSRKLRSRVGLVLLALGVVGVLWIVERVITLANGAQAVPLVAKFLVFDEAGRSIVIPGGTVVLPEGMYFAVGIFLYILVLMIVAGLARALLSTGAHLMGSEFASVANRLRAEVARLKEYLEGRNK